MLLLVCCTIFYYFVSLWNVTYKKYFVLLAAHSFDLSKFLNIDQYESDSKSLDGSQQQQTTFECCTKERKTNEIEICSSVNAERERNSLKAFFNSHLNFYYFLNFPPMDMENKWWKIFKFFIIVVEVEKREKITCSEFRRILLVFTVSLICLTYLRKMSDASLKTCFFLPSFLSTHKIHMNLEDIKNVWWFHVCK